MQVKLPPLLPFAHFLLTFLALSHFSLRPLTLLPPAGSLILMAGLMRAS